MFFPPQISAEEIKDNRVVNFEVEARKLDNKVWLTNFNISRSFRHPKNFKVDLTCFSPKIQHFPQDFFGKSDPYLEFYKQTQTGWQLAHRTEVNTVISFCHSVLQLVSLQFSCISVTLISSHLL